MDWQMLDNNSGQDIMAWITQGAIADRSLEKLGESDKGIILYRRMLRQQLAVMEAGEEPMNVFRDPEENVCIDLPWEGREIPGPMRREVSCGGRVRRASMRRCCATWWPDSRVRRR